MPYGTPPAARQLEQARFNRFLATLPPHEFALLAPHLRTITLERGVMLQDLGEEIEHVYFPHTGMVLPSMQSCVCRSHRAKSRLHGMERIARDRLLDLHQQTVVVAHDEVADRRALRAAA